MAVPIPTARQNPTATDFFLKNGFSSKITFSGPGGSQVILWEKSITPPGIDGGAPVDDSNMFCNKWQIQTPRGLATMTPIRGVVAYDPKFLNSDTGDVEVMDYINALVFATAYTTFTITFPNGDMLAVYGFLTEFIPNENVDGTQPTANITIAIANFDPGAQWPTAEAGPFFQESGS